MYNFPPHLSCELVILTLPKNALTSCRRAAATPPRPVPLLPLWAPKRRACRHNVAYSVLSHAEYVPTLTAAAALLVKAALSKAAW